MDLPKRSFAMTEQPRTIALERIQRAAGQADAATMTEIAQWLDDFLGASWAAQFWTGCLPAPSDRCRPHQVLV